MSDFLYAIFVIVVNFIGWGMLIAYVVGIILVIWASFTDKGSSSGNIPGLPWL